MRADLFEFLLENYQILVTESRDHGNLRAVFMQRLCCWISNGTADTSTDDTDLLIPVHMGRLAKRTDEIQNTVPDIQLIQQHRCLADNLKDDRNRAFFSVIIRNRQRNTLPILVHTQNNKLSCQCFFRNSRCFNNHFGNGWI